MEPRRLQKERKVKEQLVEKHINRSWEKELEGVETYCQRQEKLEGTQTSCVPNGMMDFVIYYYYSPGHCVSLSLATDHERD
jgi:hypothetical protein